MFYSVFVSRTDYILECSRFSRVNRTDLEISWGYKNGFRFSNKWFWDRPTRACCTTMVAETGEQKNSTPKSVGTFKTSMVKPKKVKEVRKEKSLKIARKPTSAAGRKSFSKHLSCRAWRLVSGGTWALNRTSVNPVRLMSDFILVGS